MNERRTALAEAIRRQRPLILEVEEHVWQHPETGFGEWATHRYLNEIIERLGYNTVPAGDIPGFYADLDTGREGPRLLIMAEMDALVCPGHPDAVDGKAHSCGHNIQCANVIGVAAALKEPGVLDELSGSIRIMFVPAEELIELEYRDGLIEQGLIRYRTGKVEFLSRGLMDGCDLGYVFHGRCDDKYDFVARGGANGSVSKNITVRGKSSHAGLSPHLGVNALYAANLGMQAVNAMRETFRDEDHVRVHPIITAGGQAVNAIPDCVMLETHVRGAAPSAINDAAAKFDRAFAGAALSMGASVMVSTRPGYSPLKNDPLMLETAKECMIEISGADKVDVDSKGWITGSTDLGDLSMVMPIIHPYACGSTGSGHGTDYQVTDKERACINSAVCQLLLADALLTDGAKRAKEVIEAAKGEKLTKAEFFAMLEAQTTDRELVTYTENGAEITLA